MEPKVYNLDENVRESFPFTIKGHQYNFRQMNTEEIEVFQKMLEEKKGDKDLKDFFYNFITPVGKETPDFQVLSRQFIAPHWKNFINMVKTELGIE